MGKEIERKFLIKGNDWKKNSKEVLFRQGYLSTVKERTVRVRTIDNKGFLTIKGITVGATRAEYEYEISVSDANEMLDSLCEKPIIEKTRTKIEYKGLIWEVDEFFGENEGLIVAEVELVSEDQEPAIPEWIGEEVTGDPRYFNSNLIKNPFKNW
ncbi:MAG: CYTH domain-containing protein [Candidatus Aminicenantes bacterium]|nr:CYTH domain-containing protein [Candidatus Aminicenantes bacterium]